MAPQLSSHKINNWLESVYLFLVLVLKDNHLHEGTSSDVPSNSSLTSSCRPSTSTSDSGAFSIFRVTSADFPIKPGWDACCWTACTDCINGLCTGSPASSKAFFFKVALIWDLFVRNNSYLWISAFEGGQSQSKEIEKFCNNVTYTVFSLMCSLMVHKSSANLLTASRSISISSSVHFVLKMHKRIRY